MLCLGKLLFLLLLLSDLDWRLVSVGNSTSSSSSTSLLLSFSDSFSVAASDSESFFCCWFVKENVYNKYEDLRTIALGGRLFVKTLPKVLKNQPGPQPFAARSIWTLPWAVTSPRDSLALSQYSRGKRGKRKRRGPRLLKNAFKCAESIEHRRGDKVNGWIFKGCGYDSGMLQDTWVSSSSSRISFI